MFREPIVDVSAEVGDEVLDVLAFSGFAGALSDDG